MWNKITSLSPLRRSSRFSSVSFCWRWGRTNDASPLLSVPSHLRCGHIFISIYSWLSDLPLCCLSMLLVVYLSFLCLWCCNAALWLATCWGGGEVCVFFFYLKASKKFKHLQNSWLRSIALASVCAISKHLFILLTFGVYLILITAWN